MQDVQMCLAEEGNGLQRDIDQAIALSGACEAARLDIRVADWNRAHTRVQLGARCSEKQASTAADLLLGTLICSPSV